MVQFGRILKRAGHGLTRRLAILAICAVALPAAVVAEDGFALISDVSQKVVRAGVGQNSLLAATSPEIKGWETFRRVDLGGMTFAMQSVLSGKYVRAGVGPGTQLAASSDHIGEWETFEWIDLGYSKMAFRSVKNGKYVRAGVGEGSFLAATSGHIAGWETFILVIVPD